VKKKNYVTTTFGPYSNNMDGFEPPTTEGSQTFCLVSRCTNISDCVQTVYGLPLFIKVVNCVVLRIVCVVLHYCQRVSTQLLLTYHTASYHVVYHHINTAVIMFTQNGAVRSADWIFINGAPAWRLLGERMTLDRTFYSLLFKQEVVAAPVIATFPSLSHSSTRHLLEILYNNNTNHYLSNYDFIN
jgi:hypothetical protein